MGDDGYNLGDLNRTMAKKMADKYDHGLEKSVREWMAVKLPERAGEIKNEGTSFHELLKTGVILCELANSVGAGIKKINRNNLVFKQMENVSSFLNACKKAGISENERFETVDLMDNKNMAAVLVCVGTFKATTTAPNFSFSASPSPARNVPSSSFPSPSKRKAVGNTSSPSSFSTPLTPPSSPANIRTTSCPTTPPSSSSSGSVSLNVTPPPNGGGRSPGRVLDFGGEGGGEEGEAVVLAVPSLEDDCRTREQFKYDYGLEKNIKDWISEVTGEPFPSHCTFAEAIKSGELLCRLVNHIEKGTISKIHKTKIGYHHIENISNYLTACENVFGLRGEDNFQTSDLYNEKNMTLVAQQIQAVAREVQKKYPDLPVMKVSQTKSLWASALSSGANFLEELGEEEDFELSDDHVKLLKWANSHLSTCEIEDSPENETPVTFEIINFGKDLRSGVKVLKLLEILAGASPGAHVKEPSSLWHFMQNSSLIFRFLNTQFTGEIPENCSSVDIIMARHSQNIKLLEFIRSKWDLNLYFENALAVEEDEGAAAALTFLQGLNSEKKLEDCVDLIDHLLKEKEGGTQEEDGEKEKEERERREREEREREEREREEREREEMERFEQEEREREQREQEEREREEREERERFEQEEREREEREREEREREEREEREREEREREEREREEQEEREREEREREDRTKRKEEERVQKKKEEEERREKEKEEKEKEQKEKEQKEKEEKEKEEQEKEEQEKKKDRRTKEEKREKKEAKKAAKEKKEREKEERRKEKEERRNLKLSRRAEREGKKDRTPISPRKKKGQEEKEKKEQQRKEREEREEQERQQRQQKRLEREESNKKDKERRWKELEERLRRQREERQKKMMEQRREKAEKFKKQKEEREKKEREERERKERERKEREEKEKEQKQAVSDAKEDIPSKEDLLALQKKMRDAQNAVRKRITMEMLETEKSYVRNLSLVNDEIVSQLSKSNEISQSEIYDMYANLPNLVNHHSTFLQKLEERVKILQECLNEGGGEEKEEDSFSNLFLRHCGFLGEYQPYLTNYHRASLYCKYYGWKSPKVSALLTQFKAKRKKTSGLGLDDFLVLPVQRVPRYALLLRELHKYTHKSDAEHERLGKAIEFIQESLRKINSNIDKDEMKLCSKLNEVENALEGFTPYIKEALDSEKGVLIQGELNLLDIKKPSKSFGKRKSRASALEGVEKGMKVYTYLFADYMILGVPKADEEQSKGANKLGKMMEKKPYVLLTLISYELVKSVTGADQKKYPKRFTLEFNSDESWVIESEEDRTMWLVRLEQCRMTCNH